MFRARFFAICLAVVIPTLGVEPPDSLIADHAPSIPDELARKAAPYLESRAASFWSWHPSRREILIGTRFAETVQLHSVRTPEGARRQLTFSPEPIATASYQPANGDYVVYQQDNGGGEFFQLYRFDPGDGSSTLLTDGKSRHSAPVWSKLGRRIAYTSTLRNGRDTDVYVMDPTNPGSARMALQATSGGWSVLDWSPDDSALLLLHYVSINESYLHLLDLATGVPRTVTPSGREKISRAGGKIARDGSSIYFTTDQDSEFMRLVRLDSTSDAGPVALTSRIKWDIVEFDLSPDGKTIAIVSNEDGFSVLRFIDAKTGRTKLEPKLPPGVITGLQFHQKNPEVAFSLASAQSPSDVYTVSLKGAVQRWTQSETGGLNPESFVGPTLEKMKSFDGLGISAFVYAPDAKRFPGKRPLLILIHGGPESQSLPTFQGRYNYLLNELGVALVVPNVRGSAGYGKTFLTLDNSIKREDSVQDIGAVIDWIQAQPNLDGGRIAVMGGSYGGYMTLASMTHFSDRLRCGIDIVGISNFITFLQNTQEYRRDLRRAEYGDERVAEVRAYLEKIAPAKNVEKITRPMMVVQGKNDPRVPISEAEQMVKALRESKIETSYLVGKDEGHGFRKKRNVDYQFYATVRFLEENLLK